MKWVMVGLVGLLGVGSALGQAPNCPVRPESGTIVQTPLSLHSKDGVLRADFTLRNAPDVFGYMHYCYNYQSRNGTEVEAPTLRLNPGDQLDLRLTNAITVGPTPEKMAGMEHASAVPASPCESGVMQATATNLHFHGLNVPPKCHQDEVIKTLIQAGDPAFEYRIQIPKNDPPGLYWYHPHPHGFSTVQVAGGASGALIIEGMEKFRPEVAGLPERLLVIRQQSLNPGTWAPGPYELTVNFQAVVPGVFPLPLIQLRPNRKEFWRVLNASAGAFLNLQVQYASTAQPVEVIALDGIPLSKTMTVTTVRLPPAGRAEFIVQGPPENTFGSLVSLGEDTGPLGDPIPAQPIANLETREDADVPASVTPAEHEPGAQRFAGLRTAAVTAQRKLYFSEVVLSTNRIKLFITVEGQTPKEFEADDPPAIVTHTGAVEDWVIENRAIEHHVFHIHQLHFLVVEVNGVPVENPNLQDTITIPYWTGSGPYPSVKLRLDFRDPATSGTFVYHCHILDHEDAGMMAKILVKAKE